MPAQRLDLAPQRAYLVEDQLSVRIFRALEVLRDLRLHRVNDHRDEQVQHHERRDQQVGDEEYPGIRRLRHDAARNLGPAFHRHHLEQREEGGTEIAEELRRDRAEQFRGHYRRYVQHERHQADDRRHARQCREQGTDHTAHRGHHRDQPQHAQHAQGAQDAERTARGHQRDPYDYEIEHAPRVVEEAAAIDEEAQQQLDHEDPQHRAVDYVKQITEACDDRGRGFETERDRVRDDQRDDRLVEARLFDENADAIAQARCEFGNGRIHCALLCGIR